MCSPRTPVTYLTGMHASHFSQRFCFAEKERFSDIVVINQEEKKLEAIYNVKLTTQKDVDDHVIQHKQSPIHVRVDGHCL